MPSWVFEERERPRLLLTLGTVAPAAGGAQVLRDLVGSLPALGVELLVAVADDVVPELGPLPDAVLAAGFLPLASRPALLRPGGASLRRRHHHGGDPGRAAAAAGPQPIVAEQYDSARRVTAYGSARQLVDQPIDPDAVVENCRALMEDDSYRVKAQALRAEVAAMPSPAAVVPLIEELAGARPGR